MTPTNERLTRLVAAEAEYLRSAGWVPNVVAPGKVRWSKTPEYGGRYLILDAVTIQRSADCRECGVID